MTKKTFKYTSQTIGFSLLISACIPTAYADISGQVFTDYNLNGTLDSTGTISNFANTMSISTAVDQGVEGVTVQATCVTGSGSANFSAVTNAQGQFTLATPSAVDGAQNCLLNLSSLPSNYSVGSQNTGDSNVLTQFVSPNASNVQFTVKQALSYCQNNPDLATNRYAHGQQTPNPPYAGNNDVTNIFAFPYNSGTQGIPNTMPTGYSSPDLDANDPAIKKLALANKVGSVFGLGWHTASKSLFAAAYMRAWSGFGPGGTGAIYRIDMTDPANPITSVYADLNQIFPATPPIAGDDPYITGIFTPSNSGHARISDGTALDGNGAAIPKGMYVASGDTTRDNQNGQIMDAVGNIAFGDLDISADGKSIFVINQANNKLYILPIRNTALTAADAALITSYDVPSSANCAANTNNAFGLGEYQGSLYVSNSCNQKVNYFNEQSIFRFDLATKQFDTTPNVQHSTDRDNYYARFALITDIVFDTKGNMTLTSRPLFGDQNLKIDSVTDAGYSMIRRACVKDPLTHLWEMEDNGSCGGITTAGKDNGIGPLKSKDATGNYTIGGGEYFFQEWPADQGSTYHLVSYGGAAQVPGFKEAAYTIADPFRAYEAGVAWLDLGLGDPATAGQRNRAYGFYRGTGAFQNGDGRPVNGKNAAIGDLEVLCDSPPVEIGNRVWQDTNGNGIQDAGEAPLAGVKVELFADKVDLDTATPLATAITDTQGYYLFSNDQRGYPSTGNNAPNDTVGVNGGFNAADIQGGRPSTLSQKFGLTALQANTNYQVVIRNAEGTSQQTALKSMLLTTSKQGADTERDSDANLLTSHAISQITTATDTNDHAVDFGFKVLSLVDLELTKSIDKTIAKLGETIIYTLTLKNNSGTTATNIQVTDILPAELSLVNATPALGSFANNIWSLPSLDQNTSTTLILEMIVSSKPSSAGMNP